MRAWQADQIIILIPREREKDERKRTKGSEIGVSRTLLILDKRLTTSVSYTRANTRNTYTRQPFPASVGPSCEIKSMDPASTVKNKAHPGPRRVLAEREKKREIYIYSRTNFVGPPRDPASNSLDVADTHNESSRGKRGATRYAIR